MAHLFVPFLTWPAAFVLGAIVSTPDAIAATSVFKRLEVPRRIVTVLEGESLVNDTVALVTYRFGVAAVLTGRFSASSAALELPLVAIGGALIGILVGLVVDWIMRRINDPPVQTTISLLAPYAAYLAAEHFGCSGALAIVTAGVLIGWRLPRMVTARTRLDMAAFWQMLVYLLNGIIFIFIGLQLPEVMSGMRHQSWRIVVAEAGAVSAAVIAVRLLWIFPAAYIPRFLFKHIRARDPYPDWRHLAIMGWAGMRGVDSLATALALPFVTGRGLPFPGRDTIIFISFVVILITLVAQGLSLPFLIRLLNVEGDFKTEREEHIARVSANKAALEYIENLKDSDPENAQSRKLLEAQYRERLAQLENDEDEAPDGGPDADRTESPLRRLALGALQVELDVLIDLRNRHRINDETLRIVQRDVDLAETRLLEMKH